MLASRGLLSPLQKVCLRVFAELSDQEEFYLTGGTALAEFYLGHRVSFDLDLFTAQEPLILPISHQFQERADMRGLDVAVARRFATFVEFVVTQREDTLRVELALDSPFRFGPPVPTQTGVLVAGWRDLSVDKLLAYYGRAEPRDAVDLHFILQREPIEDLLARAAQKDTGFDLYWMAVALNRAADFPDEPGRWPVKMLQPLEPTLIKRQFQELAGILMSRITEQ